MIIPFGGILRIPLKIEFSNLANQCVNPRHEFYFCPYSSTFGANPQSH